MEFIKSERDGHLAIVTLSRGKANALNRAMIEELYAAISEAATDEAVRGLVLASDRPKFFSAGFDIAEVFKYGRETMTSFFARFIEVYTGLNRLPKPVIAAVSGHAFAGGAVLASACDFRIMAEGNFGFALNEINLGFVLPPGMIRMVIDAMGTSQARALLLSGATISPAQALDIGLVNELAKPELVLARATAQARELAEKPAAAFAALKRSIREIIGHPATDDRQFLGPFIDHWFSPEAHARKQALMESMRR